MVFMSAAVAPHIDAARNSHFNHLHYPPLRCLHSNSRGCHCIRSQRASHLSCLTILDFGCVLIHPRHRRSRRDSC